MSVDGVRGGGGLSEQTDWRTGRNRIKRFEEEDREEEVKEIVEERRGKKNRQQDGRYLLRV